ncbi:MAG: DNA topoisomerase IV subunit A [Proteobacteria bacterium]|nr:DNA topoisomerase IV subunit A [Pseudomonadota bacterium]MBI3499893.1 DNA topoisomerase IV subunit A [Pseudomonadota bacterium]
MSAALPAGEVRATPLAEALSERYLSYALSTIMARSLPDVRDGLKPVHRRLLYAMRQLGLGPTTSAKKSARVVGDVIGKFHPHGDVAVYEALVRLAQDFAQRYPLVDGQGNFGNIDGDNAAAMRYTESRLTQVAEMLLAGIEENAVDFRQTYDGENEEPVVLPAAFPNLLANGAQGIAVGMATSIPPHNAAELCDALLHLIKHPNASFETLLGKVPGPDFPTGGVLVEPASSILEAYKTGRGSFRLRARWSVEKLAFGQYQVVVTEIPYQVAKSRLIEKIAELLAAKKLALLADVRDESTDEVRLVLEPKSRTVDPDHLMESLFRQTDLEGRIPLNLNVLDGDGVPRVMNLREALQAFLDHRHVVLVRRTKHRVDAIDRRLEILKGYLVAYLNIDKVIKIIREEDEPKPILMRRFELSDLQAESILNMRLRSLRRLEEIEIKKEHSQLAAERKDLAGLLKDEKQRWLRLAEEIAEVKKKFSEKSPLGRRRTLIADAPVAVDIPLDAMVEREDVTVLCSAKGWIRAVKGHLADDSEIKFKEGDESRFFLHAETTDKLLVAASNGRFYTIGVDKLSRGRGHGEPLRLMIDLPNDQEIIRLLVHRPDGQLLVASGDGRGFVVAEADVVASTRAGKQVMTLAEGTKLAAIARVAGDHAALVGENRKLLVIPLAELPVMARGRGITLQRYKDGGLSDATVFKLTDGLTWRLAGGRVRTETDLASWLGRRGQSGRMPPNGFPRNNRFS